MYINVYKFSIFFFFTGHNFLVSELDFLRKSVLFVIYPEDRVKQY